MASVAARIPTATPRAGWMADRMLCPPSVNGKHQALIPHPRSRNGSGVGMLTTSNNNYGFCSGSAIAWGASPADECRGRIRCVPLPPRAWGNEFGRQRNETKHNETKVNESQRKAMQRPGD